MSKYKLAIQKQSPDYQITIEFEEKTKNRAIARSQEIIKDVAEQFSKGYYTGRFYRKTFFLGWCRMATPKITCTKDD